MSGKDIINDRRQAMLTLLASILTFLGALLYGVVIGWDAHRMHAKDYSSGVGEIAAAVSLVGGGIAVTLLGTHTGAFGAFSFGLAVGFFAPALVGRLQHRSASVKPILSSPAPFVTPPEDSPISEPPESPFVIAEENPSSKEII
jgi:hypothetical protein